MEKANEIVLDLQNLEQMFLRPESVFYPNLRLNPETIEFITETAAILHNHTPIYLKVYLPYEAANGAHELESVIHQHFAYLRNKSEMKLKQTIKLGWKSLLISIIFLSLLISFATFVIQYLPKGGASIALREILVIIGWVALWRPAELLLYEWRPLKREVNLFTRLEQCNVEIIAKLS